MTVLEVERRLASLEHAVSIMAEGVSAAKVIERRMTAAEMGVRSLASVQADDVARLTSSIEVVRGLATGARGGRPRNEEREADRQALELGRQVMQAVATPEGRAQLILQLQGADPVGSGAWNPRQNGSPV